MVAPLANAIETGPWRRGEYLRPAPQARNFLRSRIWFQYANFSEKFSEGARAQDCGAHRRLTRRDPPDDHRVWRRCHIRRKALHHRRVFDFLRDLLADDRLDFLGE